MDIQSGGNYLDDRGYTKYVPFGMARMTYTVLLSDTLRDLNAIVTLHTRMSYKMPSSFWTFVGLQVNNLSDWTKNNVFYRVQDSSTVRMVLRAIMDWTLTVSPRVLIDNDRSPGSNKPIMLASNKATKWQSGKFWTVYFNVPVENEIRYVWTRSAASNTFSNMIELDKGVWRRGKLHMRALFWSLIALAILGGILLVVIPLCCCGALLKKKQQKDLEEAKKDPFSPHFDPQQHTNIIIAQSPTAGPTLMSPAQPVLIGQSVIV
eukprot:Platyproteum_vivax@DN3409_c0_g1_i1.p1